MMPMADSVCVKEAMPLPASMLSGASKTKSEAATSCNRKMATSRATGAREFFMSIQNTSER
jgi:hypothetical protein